MLDPQVRDCLTLAPGSETEEFFLTAPVRWIDENDKGEMVALGVGTLDGQQRKTPVATLHSLLTRIATHQSQKAMQEANLLNSRPPQTDADGQAPAPNPPPSAEKVVAAMEASVSHASGISSIPNHSASVKPAPETDPTRIEPRATTDEASVAVSDPPKESLSNGGPPEKLAMPEAFSPMEPTKTEFITPPNDPEVNRQLQ